jgi:uncharacterized membrane protein
MTLPAVVLVQVDVGAHTAALVGMVGLAILASALVIRNRLETDRAVTSHDSATPAPFRTDRERVHQLIEDNGGRMRQSDIVDSVEWSKAKVSRLLADLEEEGEITKLRLGRENLICLAGHEPTASKSPEQPQSE